MVRDRFDVNLIHVHCLFISLSIIPCEPNTVKLQISDTRCNIACINMQCIAHIIKLMVSTYNWLHSATLHAELSLVKKKRAAAAVVVLMLWKVGLTMAVFFSFDTKERKAQETFLYLDHRDGLGNDSLPLYIYVIQCSLWRRFPPQLTKLWTTFVVSCWNIKILMWKLD